MKTVFARAALVVAVVLVVAGTAMAQDTTEGLTAEESLAVAEASNFGVGLGAPIGMGLSVIGIGIGLGLIGFSALSGMARQPEQAGQLTGTMLLMAALVEGAGIISIILCVALMFF